MFGAVLSIGALFMISLLSTASKTLESRFRFRDNWLFAFSLTLFALFLLRVLLLYGSPYTLAPDEAHYWEWSRHLDWSYYSKGPTVALLIRLGVFWLGDTLWAVRLPALISSLVMAGSLFVAMLHVVSPGTALLALVVLHTSAYFNGLGLGMTTDPPCLALWALGFVALLRALEGEVNSRWWYVLAVAWGLAALTKLTALVAFPGLLCAVLAVPRYRWCLKSCAFWAAFWGHFVFLLPVVFWNTQHGWVNVLHNSGHIASKDGAQIRLDYVFEFVGAQLGLIGPLLLPIMVALPLALVIRERSERTDRIKLFLFPGILLLLICLSVSLYKRVYPNWSAPAYLYLTVAMAIALEQAREPFSKLMKWAVGLNVVMLLVAYLVVLGFYLGITGDRLPTKKLVGWDVLGEYIHESFSDLPVITERYDVGSAIAFYAPHHPTVLCAVTGTRRMNQYDIWGGWSDLRGRDALIVLQGEEVPQELRSHFGAIERVGNKLEVNHHGSVVRTFFFFRGVQYDGFVPSLPERF